MMSSAVFQTPVLHQAELRVIAQIEELRRVLGTQIAEPRRWLGGLRRMSLARVVQASNEIEGYHASLDDVVAIGDGEATRDADGETALALVGYRDAMTYVLQSIHDPDFALDEGLVKALQFMMLKHDLDAHPGRWRPGPIFVTRQPTGERVYEGPAAERIAGLVGAMLAALDADASPAIVRAAMVHLNLVMIHPFRDGNGRMARALQSLVLAQERILAPAFSSIEEYLAHNTPAYYAVLGQVGQGGWHPSNDARPWIRFCLTAHLRQAMTLEQRIKESEALWVRCEALAARPDVPERATGALWDAARGLRIRRSSYQAVVKLTSGEEVSDLTASRDLRALVDGGLLVPDGERRGRTYTGAAALRGLWDAIRAERPPIASVDPFDPDADQLRLTTV